MIDLREIISLQALASSLVGSNVTATVFTPALVARLATSMFDLVLPETEMK
jgi:hypothetical protein